MKDTHTELREFINNFSAVFDDKKIWDKSLMNIFLSNCKYKDLKNYILTMEQVPRVKENQLAVKLITKLKENLNWLNK